MTDAVAPKLALDMRVPILGAIALAITIAGGIAAGAQASYRIDQLEHAQADLKDVPATLDRLDERTLQMSKQLDRLAPRQ